ncbi:phage head closure protein [Azospirillum argentinense]
MIDRERAGRETSPSAGVVDSQSVKAPAAAERTGYRTGAGELDQRVAIEREDRIGDGGGGATVAWVPVCTVWAKVWPVSGDERARAQQREASVLVRMRIRRRGDVAPEMRARWNGQTFNIRFVADAGRDPFLTLDCETG